MALGFSQRMGLKPIRTILQVDDMDIDLRNSLWNYIDRNLLHYSNGGTNWVLLDLLWTEYSKNKRVIVGYGNQATLLDYYYKKFTDDSWFEVYDILQFIFDNNGGSYDKYRWAEGINSVLEREMSGYRIINNEITPITDKSEIAEIEEASENTKANIHIKSALLLLSDRKAPDYRNSVKESISAVEAICRDLTGKTTLGSALDYMKSKDIIDINGDFKSGLEKIYWYTNDETTGIRHALMDTGKGITFEDAKFMLVLCSAFVNYITAKAKMGKCIN